MVFTQDMILDRALRDPPSSEEELERLGDFKSKEYELIVLGQRLYNEQKTPFEAFKAQMEAELGEPFSFSRAGKMYSTSPAKVTLQRLYQHPKYCIHAIESLGWCGEFRVRICEGKHHQIRRMAQRSKLMVLSLTRTHIAGILRLDSIPKVGQGRWLLQHEIDTLRRGLGLLEEDTLL